LKQPGQLLHHTHQQSLLPALHGRCGLPLLLLPLLLLLTPLLLLVLTLLPAFLLLPFQLLLLLLYGCPLLL
jgi:hypothetical protein